MRGLAAAGLPLGIVSGALRDEVEGALRQEGLRDCFKVLVTADDVASSKPDPEGYRRGIAELNSAPPLPERLLHPHEIVAIEDTAAGIEAARAAGLRVLAVAHTYPAADLAAAERVVERIGDLTVEEVVGDDADARRYPASAAVRSPPMSSTIRSDDRPRGRVEVITGGMFSGKSEELVRRLRRATIARQHVQVFKPVTDTRTRPSGW